MLSPAHATTQEYYRISRDQGIIQALDALSQTSARESIDFMLENDVKILFKNMRELGNAYKNHDALTWISPAGQQIIFINQKHVVSPPQALAALISHEVMHNDGENSVQEEVMAWNQEGRIWKELLGLYPDLHHIKPRTIALVDRLNAILVLQGRDALHHEIENNVAYKGLPPRSPGF